MWNSPAYSRCLVFVDSERQVLWFLLQSCFPAAVFGGCCLHYGLLSVLHFSPQHSCACGLKLQSHPNGPFELGQHGPAEGSWKVCVVDPASYWNSEQVAETCGSHWNLWTRTFQSLTQPGSARASADGGVKSSRTWTPFLNDDSALRKCYGSGGRVAVT